MSHTQPATVHQYSTEFRFKVPSQTAEVTFPWRFVAAVLLVAIAIHGIAIQLWHLLETLWYVDVTLTVLFAVVFLFMAKYLWDARKQSYHTAGYQAKFSLMALLGAMSVIGFCHAESKLAATTIGTVHAEDEEENSSHETECFVQIRFWGGQFRFPRFIEVAEAVKAFGFGVNLKFAEMLDAFRYPKI